MGPRLSAAHSRRRRRRRHYTCMFLKLFSFPWEWNAAGFCCMLTKYIREVIGYRTDCLDWGWSAFSLSFQRWYRRVFPVNHSQSYYHIVLYILCTWVTEKNSLHGIQFRNAKAPGYPAYSPDVPSDYNPFIALKQNPGGHTFKDDRDLETVLTFSLVTRDRD
jgi:hypothetical protein